ncbi:hypothetical protein DFH08DRAFT_975809 [Mycena albidolilacea]|uniref:Uncharacterized protein n=1 Tax=Mycena albidolilacea TaxID=1033008 RepID=A0AAD7EAS4_9AGAR|nr:hypothetical protein DFH08DRAFT_975809 [Mycena albidolilacea]
MITIIQKCNPAILHNFKCSERFVRSFLKNNAGELCEHTFFRLDHVIESEHIPASLIINYDQTGNYVLPNGSQTFEQRGAKQVSVVAKDEKRAYTLGIATSLIGRLLVIEQVWSGKTKASLPKESADGYKEAKAHGFRFSFAASDKKTSHFSTQSTMKDWITFVLVLYIEMIIETDPDLDEDQKAILYIYIYPVHTSQEFREFVFEIKNIILIFVTGNCTGIFQPQDSMLEYLVCCYQEQIAAGITPEKVVFSSSYPVLQDASVRAGVDLYDWLLSGAGEAIIKQDDSDVLLGKIVRDALRAGLDGPSTSLPVSAAAQDIEGTDMCATSDEEDIWVFDDQGWKWVDVGAPVDNDGEDGTESSQNA